MCVLFHHHTIPIIIMCMNVFPKIRISVIRILGKNIRDSIVGKSLKLEMGWIMVANTKPQKLGEYFGIEFQQEIR